MRLSRPFIWLLAATIVHCSTALAEVDQEIWDPLEPFNRGVFWFNDQVDTYLLEPVARAYDHVIPSPVQKSVTNFFDNLGFPGRFLSSLARLDISQAGDDTARFLINSTAGVGGLFDIATQLGVEENKRGFAVALASYDIPHGPYLVVPFFGPTTLRDGIGRGVDGVVHPFAILSYSDVRSGISDKVTWYGLGLDTVQTRSNMIEAIEAARESSLDFYLFVQSAYYQHRRGLLNPEEQKAAGKAKQSDLRQDDDLVWED